MKFPSSQNSDVGSIDSDRNGVYFYLGKMDGSYLGKYGILKKESCSKRENRKICGIHKVGGSQFPI